MSADDLERLRTTADAVCAEAEAAGGRVLLRPEQVADADGALLIGPTVVQLPASAAMRPESWAAREIFGPIVHCIATRDLDEALGLQAGLDYALTAGVYAQSEDDVDAVIAGARAGNVYVNRPITGARVGIEPFGGFALSGTGPKAGGVAYLRAFRGAVDGAADGDATPPAAPAAPTALPAAPPWPWPLRVVAPHIAFRTDGNPETWRRLADIPTLSATAAPVIAEARRQLAQRRATHAIPGQRTEEHTRRRRGPMLVISHADALHDATLQAIAAAIAVGNPVWLVGTAARAPHFVALTGRDLDVHISTDASPATWYAAATSPAIATIVLDGASDPAWAPWLQLALTSRPMEGCLPALLRPQASQTAADAVRDQLLVSTIAVNTLRHGAPLVLDLPEADGVT